MYIYASKPFIRNNFLKNSLESSICIKRNLQKPGVLRPGFQGFIEVTALKEYEKKQSVGNQVIRYLILLICLYCHLRCLH